jgi:hypothetical protein
MTTLVVPVLLIAFVAIATAQSCTFCPDNGVPLYGDLFLYKDETGPVTCEEIVQDFINEPPEDCTSTSADSFKFACGCPGVESGPCSGICDIGSIVTLPELVVGFFGTTCFVFDQLIKGEPNATNCPDLGGSDIKSLCGCELAPTVSQADFTNSFVGGGKGGEGDDRGGGGGGADNKGMGMMMTMPSGRQLRLSGLEKRFPRRTARGLAM